MRQGGQAVDEKFIIQQVASVDKQSFMPCWGKSRNQGPHDSTLTHLGEERAGSLFTPLQSWLRLTSGAPIPCPFQMAGGKGKAASWGHSNAGVGSQKIGSMAHSDEDKGVRVGADWGH